jgi:hypothetical protein
VGKVGAPVGGVLRLAARSSMVETWPTWVEGEVHLVWPPVNGEPGVAHGVIWTDVQGWPTEPPPGQEFHPGARRCPFSDWQSRGRIPRPSLW